MPPQTAADHPPAGRPLSPSQTSGSPASPTTIVTATVLLVSSLTILANATVAPSLPGLARAFADTPGIETLAGLVVSLPSLAVVLTAALFGWSADRFDRRKILVLAMVAYAFGGASVALAQTMPQILAGRLVLGVGVAGTLTIATQIATDLWHGPERARFMGWQGAVISASGIVSLVVGGLLAEVDWRAPFLIYLLALPVAALAWFVLPARNEARNRGAAPPSASAAVPDEAFPWSVLALTAGIMFLAMVFILLTATRLPFLLNDIGIRSPGVIGLTLALMTVASFPTGLFYGRIRAMMETRTIAVLALGLMGAGYAIISQSDALAFIVVGILVTGAGVGLIIPNQNVWLMAHVPEAARGRASGLMTTFLFAGQFVSPILSGMLLTAMNLPSVFLTFALVILAVAMLLWIGRRAEQTLPTGAAR